MDRLPDTMRAQARRLRGELGLSLGEIATRIGISESTARRWTLDIRLSQEQKAEIEARRIVASRNGSAIMAANYRARRLVWQEEGRRRAQEGDRLHLAGCLLYWAEGSKSRNTLILANSDLHLMRLFRHFLTECLGIAAAEMTFRLHVYTGNGLTIPAIEEYWLRGLDLPVTCLRKHHINKRPAPTSGVKKNKLPYGVGNLGVNRSTRWVQHIYGAIREYGGLDEPVWLD